MKFSLFSTFITSALAAAIAHRRDLDRAIEDLRDVAATAQAADKFVSPHWSPRRPVVPIAQSLESRIDDIEFLLSDIIGIFEETLPSDLTDAERIKFCIPIKDAIASQKTLVEDLFKWSGIFARSHIPIRECYESWLKANTKLFNLLNNMGVDSCGWNRGAFYSLLGTLKGLIHSVPGDKADEL